MGIADQLSWEESPKFHFQISMELKIGQFLLCEANLQVQILCPGWLLKFYPIESRVDATELYRYWDVAYLPWCNYIWLEMKCIDIKTALAHRI